MSDTLTFTAAVEIQAAAGSKQPTLTAVAYDGGEIRLPGWGTVVVDLSAADVSGVVPVLADHGQQLDSIAGQGTAEIKGGKILVSGVLTDATTSGQRAIALAKSGVMPQASIGFAPTKREHISAGQTVHVNGRTFTAGPDGLTVIRAGKLREISLVPVGANAGTSVSIAATRTSNMSTDGNPTTTIEPTLPERVQARWDAERWHDPQGLPRQRAQTAMLSAACGRITFEDFERQLLTERLRDAELRAIRNELPKGPAIHASTQGVAGPEAIEAALLCHMGHEPLAAKQLGERAVEAGRLLRATHVLDLCKASLQAVGREIPASRDDMLRASFSTTSLPGILGNVGNKISLEAYRSVPSVARIIARKLSANDFKTHTGYRLTGDSKFDEVGAGGAIHHGTLAESSFTFSISTYAKMFALTRNEIINDDLGKLDEVPRMLGRGAAVKLEEIFWTLVLANTGSFFHGDNANLSTSSALAVAGLTKAVTLMRQMVDSEGIPVLVEPKYLVVPPELEATADGLYSSLNLAVTTPIAEGVAWTMEPDGNPFKGKYQPLVVPHLSNDSFSGYSATSWYLFGAPSDVAAFGIGYLNGVEAPTVETADTDFSTLGIQYRGYMDFGVCQIDHRGGVMATA